jgi:acetyltransferase-like isoleucine patch superfamily enzyme
MSPFDKDTDPILRRQIIERFVGELMSDHERAKLFGLPKGCRIRERAKILAPEKFVCGKNVWIGEGALLDAQGGLEIGDGTQIGVGVLVWSHSSHRQALAGKTGHGHEGIEYKRTRIGCNAFILGPSVIAPGVTIGDRVIVQALSFVDRDLPDGAIFGTARRMRKMEERIAVLEAALRSAAVQKSSPRTASRIKGRRR